MKSISRRALIGSMLPAARLKAAAATIGFGFGTYGMKALPWDQALRTVADIGYDGVEISLLPEWPTEPRLLSPGDRKRMRELLGELRLALPSFLEALPITGTPQGRTENIERLKRAMQLGHDLSPKNHPVIETVLGGKTADWDRVKASMVAELKDWAKAAEAGATIVCFKPHAAHAVQSPERALWLIREVGSQNIRLVYDFSHMYVEGFELADSLKALLPFAPFIHVKDSSGTPASHDYLLPGDGKTDYVAYFRLLKEHGYRGFVVVEVSAMIHRKPGYEPVPTAKLCYRRLAEAFERAGVARPPRGRA
jgi:sugar phosphate isomerase/epimerase